MTVPFALFLLYLLAMFVLSWWLGEKYYRPWMQRRAEKQRREQLEIAHWKYQRDRRILGEILEEEGM
ncbi:hypothetical protein [Dietzia natronolimnaea]|uniref:hypothetical protein n=1 Tax=Dietzia natronolimnaea TaxID=161920 RepID=UPI0015FE4338|nr:hypothetical protein [Dietzia natronolimnaea]MBB1037347.1 hypothetical protein [Dietzia natronolimnaea]